MTELQTIEFTVKAVVRKTKGNFVSRSNLIQAIRRLSDPEFIQVGKSEYAVLEWEIKEA